MIHWQGVLRCGGSTEHRGTQEADAVCDWELQNTGWGSKLHQLQDLQVAISKQSQQEHVKATNSKSKTTWPGLVVVYCLFVCLLFQFAHGSHLL